MIQSTLFGIIMESNMFRAAVGLSVAIFATVIVTAGARAVSTNTIRIEPRAF